MITGHKITIETEDTNARAQRNGWGFSAHCECGWHVGSGSKRMVGHLAVQHLERIENAGMPSARKYKWQYSG